MDSPLWKLLFRLEGWNSNFPQVREYEETERQRRAGFKEKERKTRPRAAEDMDLDKPSSKRRVRGGASCSAMDQLQRRAVWNRLHKARQPGASSTVPWKLTKGLQAG